MIYTQEFVETLYIEVKNLQKKVEQLKEYKIFGNYLVKVLDSLIEVKEDLRKETENE